MTVIRSSDAPRFDLPGVQFTAFASPDRGSAQLCLWRITVAPGHTSADPHYLDHDEVFLVTAGEARFTPGGPAVGAGDVAVVPAGSPIALTNLTGDPLEVVVAIRAGFAVVAADGSPLSGPPPWAC
jgi:mannose-6-phosphate isomerase-like protein (cupin superfamily)